MLAKIKIYEMSGANELTNWGQDKMANIFQMTFSNSFLNESVVFDLNFIEIQSQWSN